MTPNTIEHSDTPSAEFRFFIFDPLGYEFVYFRTAEDRDQASDGIIQSYLDDGWNEEVERVIAGEITHTCDKVNVQDRPPEEEIDGEGYDQNGDYWAEEWSYKCNYELLPLAEAGKAPQAAIDVLAERRRQVEAEGWTPAHDDLYCAAELPRAAASYILNGANDEAPCIWPFASKWWKPRDARSNYVRAGALIIAEIERLDRAAEASKAGDV